MKLVLSLSLLILSFTSVAAETYYGFLAQGHCDRQSEIAQVAFVTYDNKEPVVIYANLVNDNLCNSVSDIHDLIDHMALKGLFTPLLSKITINSKKIVTNVKLLGNLNKKEQTLLKEIIDSSPYNKFLDFRTLDTSNFDRDDQKIISIIEKLKENAQEP